MVARMGMLANHTSMTPFLRYGLLFLTVTSAITLGTTALLLTIVVKKFSHYKCCFYIVLMGVFWITSLELWLLSVTRFVINFTSSFNIVNCTMIVMVTRCVSLIVTCGLFFLVIERWVRLISPEKHARTVEQTSLSISVSIVASLSCSVVFAGDILHSLLQEDISRPIKNCIYSVVLKNGYGLITTLIYQTTPCLVLCIGGIALAVTSSLKRKAGITRPPPYVARQQDALSAGDYQSAISIGVMCFAYGFSIIPISSMDVTEFISQTYTREKVFIPLWVVGVCFTLVAILPIVQSAIFLSINKHMWPAFSHVLRTVICSGNENQPGNGNPFAIPMV